MQIRQFSFLTIGFALALATLPAQAETFDFGAYLHQTVSLTVEAYASGETDGSFYVGLTQGVITVGNETFDPFYMYCVDFNHDISVPTTYNVTIQSLTNSFTDVGGLGLPLSTLQLMSTLGLDFGQTPSGNAAQDSDIQHDIWNLSGGNFNPPNANMTALYNAANASYATGDYSDQYFLDITGTPGQQAFMPVDVPAVITHTNNANPTPEPSTFGLMIMAVAGLGFAARKKLPGRV